MFHITANFVAAGVNAADTDTAFVNDTVFGARNNHLILTDDVDLIGAAHLAVSATRSRYNSPTLNTYARNQIWPVNRSATPPSPPRIMDLRHLPLRLPKVEEIAIEVSNNLGAATEDTTVFQWLAPPGFNRNVPRGLANITVRATGAVATVADSWSGPGAITFAEALRGGWWAVTAAYCQAATTRAFRLFFPRAPQFAGRSPMRPGHLVSNALGDLEPYQLPKDELGVWGAFHTFEPVQIETYADAAGAATQEIRLQLVYLGDGDQSRYPLGII